jgi:hypothetical protein
MEFFKLKKKISNAVSESGFVANIWRGNLTDLNTMVDDPNFKKKEKRKLP